MRILQKFLLTAVCLTWMTAHLQAGAPIHSFATGGSPVYQLLPGTVDRGGRVIISAAYDGTVQCHRPDGTLVWNTETGGCFPNDLAVTDLDGDGLDDSLIASGDGSLCVFDHNGKLRWKYAGVTPLLGVCVLKAGVTNLILTGGIDKTLYAFTIDGTLVHSYTTEYIVRFIRKGSFLGDGRDYAAVVTARRVRGQDNYFLQLYDPDGLTPLWNEPINVSREYAIESYFDMLSVDVDADGKDDVILCHGWRSNGKLSAYNGAGDIIRSPEYTWPGRTSTTYRVNHVTHIKSPSLKDEYLLGLFGNQLVKYNLDLTVREVFTTAYSYAKGSFDPVTNTYYMGSSISGGNCIHAIDLTHEHWGAAFERLEPAGNLDRVLNNLAKLSREVDRFVRPSYQPAPASVQIIGNVPEQSVHASLPESSFSHYIQFGEAYDRSSLPGVWKTKKETRFEYTDTQEEIWQYAQSMERQGKAFSVWAGHGNDPFYMQFETLDGIIQRAPNSFKAFVFAELVRRDEPMISAVNERIIPLAQLCQRHRKKIFLRNHNVFWLGTCYLDLWKNTLLNRTFSDVFIPSMEETGDRCQELSLSGRVGLWLTGYFDQCSSRAVTDNASYSALWHWTAQQVLTHLMRSMVLQASLGADVFMINTYQGDPLQFIPFYTMLAKGIIYIPKREDLLSVSDVCLGIRTPSKRYIEHATNSWEVSGYQPEDRTFVFDRLAIYWGGARILPHDFSYYGMGCQTRRLNFLPRNPYGLVAFVPDNLDLSQHRRFTHKVSTDGEYFYDDQGDRHSAEAYKPVVEQLLQDAAQRLPVRVEGEVAWSAVRVDPHHIRLVLIDSGYIDPAERSAVIRLQHVRATECRDILSNETLPVIDDSVSVTVPAGIFRVLDVTHQ